MAHSEAPAPTAAVELLFPDSVPLCLDDLQLIVALAAAREGKPAAEAAAAASAILDALPSPTPVFGLLEAMFARASPRIVRCLHQRRRHFLGADRAAAALRERLDDGTPERAALSVSSALIELIECLWEASRIESPRDCLLLLGEDRAMVTFAKLGLDDWDTVAHLARIELGSWCDSHPAGEWRVWLHERRVAAVSQRHRLVCFDECQSPSDLAHVFARLAQTVRTLQGADSPIAAAPLPDKCIVDVLLPREVHAAARLVAVSPAGPFLADTLLYSMPDDEPLLRGAASGASGVATLRYVSGYLPHGALPSGFASAPWLALADPTCLDRAPAPPFEELRFSVATSEPLVEPGPPAPEHGWAPMPFSLSQLRAATPDGREDVFRVAAAGKPATLLRMAFYAPTVDGVRVREYEWPETGDESAAALRDDYFISWARLHSFARFPALATSIVPHRTLTTPAGTFAECLCYTLLQPETGALMRRFYYAPTQPGAPVLMERFRGGLDVVFSMALVRYTRPQPQPQSRAGWADPLADGAPS